MSVRASELDIVFISLDEPCAEIHWQDLQRKIGHAKRVQGVLGMNSAFLAAAKLAETERFITVDADCLIDPAFLDHHIAEEKLNSNKVISWPARNAVNGLVYGNGGLKCWTRSMLSACKQPDSKHFDHPDIFGFLFEAQSYASCHPNSSPLHAFRGGFREGARLSYVKGTAPGLDRLREALPVNNLRRLLSWCNIGVEMPFGVYCIWGARLGCLMTQRGELDPILLADFFRFGDFFDERIWPKRDQISEELAALAEPLRDAGLEVFDLENNDSALFQTLLESPSDITAFDMQGNQYRSGDLKAHPSRTFETYLTGALLGNSNAMNNLARCYRDGIGTAKDSIQARNWLLNAAACENRFALLRLGEENIRDGDIDHAKLWLSRAAEAGSCDAKALLGELPT